VLCVAIVVPLLLPDRFSLASKWIEPAVLALLLVAHTIADPGRIDRQSSATRTIGVGLLVVLVVGATTQAIVLTVELVNGNKALNNPHALLSSGARALRGFIQCPAQRGWSLPSGSAATARASRSHASCSNAATTSSKPSATRPSHPSPNPMSRGKPQITR
jgi:hypothetical protein